jgi:hypothetical protein
MSKEPISRSADDRYAVRCLNGLKHGSTARKLFLPDENQNDFFVLLEATFETYKPRTKRDAHFVADLAYARWFVLRRERAAKNYEFQLRLQKPDPDVWTADDHHQIRLLKRYQIEAERAVQSALGNLHHFDEDGLRVRPWHDLYRRFMHRLHAETSSRLAA